MAYGITATGFSKKTLAIIKSELEDSYRQSFGNSINLNPPSNMATILGISAEREAKIWDLAEEGFNSRSPSSAQGVALDNARELTNETRIPAAPSKTFQQIFFGTVGTVVDDTFIAAVFGNPLAKFSPTGSVTLIAGTNAVQHLAFNTVPDAGTWTITMPDGQTTGSLVYNAIAAAIQTAIHLLTGWTGVTVSGNYTAGFTFTFASDSGLQPQEELIGNSSLTTSAVAVVITQSDTTVGVAQGTLTMEALADGPTVADANTLTVINTPVAGLTSTKNLDDATLGRYIETDSEYRIRSANDVQNTSASTVEAIRIKVKAALDVREAIVYENTTLITDGNGVPGKAVHIYVDGGTDQDVGDAIWLAVGGGIETYGAVTVSVTDSQGIVQTVKFDRPTEKPVYVIVDVTTDSEYPATGNADVKAAVVAYGAALKIGEDVLLYPKLLPAIVDNVPGIIDITIKIGFAPTPTLSANLAIALSERATFSSSNISVI